MPKAFGRAIESSGRILVPVAKSVRLRTARGGLVWNRPDGVWIEEPAGSRYLRVRDRTREIQWLLLGLGLAAALWIRFARRAGPPGPRGPSRR